MTLISATIIYSTDSSIVVKIVNAKFKKGAHQSPKQVIENPSYCVEDDQAEST